MIKQNGVVEATTEMKHAKNCSSQEYHNQTTPVFIVAKLTQSYVSCINRVYVHIVFSLYAATNYTPAHYATLMYSSTGVSLGAGEKISDEVSIQVRPLNSRVRKVEHHPVE